MEGEDPSTEALDDRRKRVYEALVDRSPELAGYYRVAISVLRIPAAPGEQRAKVSVVCHLFREVANGLAFAMGETSSPPVKPSSVRLLSRLVDTRLDLSGDEEMVPVRRDVATPLDEILRTATLENARVADDLASLFAGEKSKSHPLVKQWKDAHDYFLDWTHWDKPRDENRPIPSDADMEARIRIIEDVVEARAGAFFDARHAIDDLLLDANRMVEGEPE